jgi:glutamate-1-semialdehyde 2,1-aminomutase
MEPIIRRYGLLILNEGYSGGRFVTKAQGRHIWINGKCLIDFSLCGGTHIFGHTPNFVQKAIKFQMKLGNSFAYPNDIASKYSNEFKNHSPLESLVFCNSGSESVMRAFRIARAYTGRPKVAIFEGAWHGSYDDTVFATNSLGVNSDNVLLLPYDLSSIEILSKHSNVALVFIEPFQGSNPQDKSNLINHLSHYCLSTNTLFGFDEIISGFRYPGIDHYQVIPDIATYGKIAGGGFPIGIVAGKPHMNIINSGVFMGGTFSANPITLTAGLEIISRIDPLIRLKLEEKSNTLKSYILGECKHLSLMGVGSFLRLMFMKQAPENCAHRDKLELSQTVKNRVYENLFNSGIYLGKNGLVFLSTLHTDSDIEQLAECLINEDLALG